MIDLDKYKITDYKIVTANTYVGVSREMEQALDMSPDLETKVLELIMQGYTPLGGVSSLYKYNFENFRDRIVLNSDLRGMYVLSQAMVKLEAK